MSANVAVTDGVSLICGTSMRLHLVVAANCLLVAVYAVVAAYKRSLAYKEGDCVGILACM
jgi:hypothetical protein